MSNDFKQLLVVPTNVERDTELARTNIIDAITIASQTVAELQQLADQSQSPRFYQILNETLRTMVDASDKLLDIQKKTRDLTQKTTEKTQTINNNLIVTTAELHDMLLANAKK